MIFIAVLFPANSPKSTKCRLRKSPNCCGRHRPEVRADQPAPWQYRQPDVCKAPPFAVTTRAMNLHSQEVNLPVFEGGSLTPSCRRFLCPRISRGEHAQCPREINGS